MIYNLFTLIYKLIHLNAILILTLNVKVASLAYIK